MSKDQTHLIYSLSTQSNPNKRKDLNNYNQTTSIYMHSHILDIYSIINPCFHFHFHFHFDLVLVYEVY